MQRPLTAYERWLEKEGLPVLSGYAVDNILTASLKPWARLGGKGAYVNLAAFEGVTGAYICEIPPGGELNPEKHIFEELIYVVEGHGATEVWQEGGRKNFFEWQRGSLFAPPLNSWHKLINGSSQPAVLFTATTAPLVMDQFHNEDFIFNNPFCFADRYAGEEDYFTRKGEREYNGFQWVWETNFVSDVRTVELNPGEKKVSKGHLTIIEPSKNVFIAHLADWPSGRYHKAHYHSAGAILLIIKGKGYTLMWPKDLGIHPYASGYSDQIVRIDWKEGTLFCPPDGWFHQHFNTGRAPARQLALRYGSRRQLLLRELARKGGEMEGVVVSVKEGGTLIEYEDEDPEIRKAYAEEIKKSGIELTMPKF